ncbi:MAG TPA: hypothetical protein VLX58_01560 [Bryobacteraceae bacterium]|nr:hypothetical protein [Bryobacteraceae bacterium]
MAARPGTNEDRVKRIEITVDKKGTPHVGAGLQDVTIDRTKDEEVIWVSELPFRIDFGGDSPFYESQFDHRSGRSGLVRRGVISSKTRGYKYTIEIEGKTLDPKIFVFP